MKRFSQISSQGFTLAEVLITLGIIGIVASLTIPSLLNNADDRANVVALKKTYSTLENAYKRAEQENGTPDNWGFVHNSTDYTLMVNMLKPYLNVSKDCSAAGAKGCFKANEMYKLFSGGNWDIRDNAGYSLLLADGVAINGYALHYKDCDNGAQGDPWGTSIALQNGCGFYAVDVNGFKGPNKLGYDSFFFVLTKYGIIPAGDQSAGTGFPFIGNCIDSSGVAQNGTGCAAWAIVNDNLDYAKCGSQLTNGWNGKTKCN